MGFHGCCFLGKSSYLDGWWVLSLKYVSVSCRCSGKIKTKNVHCRTHCKKTHKYT
jgi:hypothetical protein